MAYYAHKVENTTLEQDTCEILFLDSLFISDNSYCFSLNIEEIYFPLAPQIMKAEHNLGLQTGLSTNISTNLNNDNSNWK